MYEAGTVYGEPAICTASPCDRRVEVDRRCLVDIDRGGITGSPGAWMSSIFFLNLTLWVGAPSKSTAFFGSGYYTPLGSVNIFFSLYIDSGSTR